jgi:hypothetical protein
VNEVREIQFHAVSLCFWIPIAGTMTFHGKRAKPTTEFVWWRLNVHKVIGDLLSSIVKWVVAC